MLQRVVAKRQEVKPYQARAKVCYICIYVSLVTINIYRFYNIKIDTIQYLMLKM